MTVKKWQRLWESKMAGSFLWELIKKRKLFPAKNGLTLREGWCCPVLWIHICICCIMHLWKDLWNCLTAQVLRKCLLQQKKDWRRVKVRSWPGSTAEAGMRSILISRAIRIRMSWMHSQRKFPSLWCVSAGTWLCATAVVWSFWKKSRSFRRLRRRLILIPDFWRRMQYSFILPYWKHHPRKKWKATSDTVRRNWMNVDLQVYSPMILPPFREKIGVGSWPPTRHWMPEESWVSAIMSSAFLSGRRMRRLLSRKDIVPGRGEITLRSGRWSWSRMVPLVQEQRPWMSLTRIRRKIPGSSHSVRMSLTIYLLFLTGIRCRRRYTV